MDAEPADSSPAPPVNAPESQPPPATDSGSDSHGAPTKQSSGLSSWAKNLKLHQPLAPTQDSSQSGNSGQSSFSRFTSGLGLRLSPKAPPSDDISNESPTTLQPGFIGTITKGIVDSSKSAVKAVQVKARHVVSQNKRRYQEGGFDLDMTYITENIIAMGFPAGDMSSGFFGYVEGFYRNHMEEVIKFFETHHKDKYKVYNLCSERLYDASLFEGKVASFPFDDHNCPPIHLITLFCRSAYAWLKEDIENVVVVHCKAGMARTGLMISSLLLYLKTYSPSLQFFPTAEESIDYYNQKRCFDGKGLVLPSQIVSSICYIVFEYYIFLRYVKYFERILTYFNGENPPGRRCMLRGFRLHRCPYWIRPSITVSDHNGVLFSTKEHPRTKGLSPEDYWFSAPKKGVMVFALPGELGLTELVGDFKVHFHDRQGDFYCWLNTTMTENRKVLTNNDLDGFDKRKLPSPGFQVEVVLVDYSGNVPTTPNTETSAKKPDESSGTKPSSDEGGAAAAPQESKSPGSQDKDDVFSDSEAEEGGSAKSRQAEATSPPTGVPVASTSTSSESDTKPDQISSLTNVTKQVSIGNTDSKQGAAASEPKSSVSGGNAPGLEASSTESEFKAMAADASVFSFGDDEDSESE
ncbi:hypothetical protein DVH24_021689 [Malus domestica]|uniref:Phosphatidylinositol-3,4,5-trisphosphate 3-phosphatase n=1 Tax=Malus domestica TaxID=3750 RepID=A0A498JY50_MALDO|nr:hypothetical protein DVH24_021689 [Malus domestica]